MTKTPKTISEDDFTQILLAAECVVEKNKDRTVCGHSLRAIYTQICNQNKENIQLHKALKKRHIDSNKI